MCRSIEGVLQPGHGFSRGISRKEELRLPLRQLGLINPANRRSIGPS
jgi:hypothetical protein